MIVAAEFIPHLPTRLSTGRAAIAAWMGRVVAVLKDFAPYAAVELILPGGSVLALVLWLYRRHQNSDPASARGLISAIARGPERAATSKRLTVIAWIRAGQPPLQ